MPNFSASSIWGFLDRPFISRSFSLSTHPLSSGIVGGRCLADNGRNSRRPRPLSFATTWRLCLFCDMGLWPSTSPDMTKLAPSWSNIWPATLNIRAWQSIHGFMCLPIPCLGALSISRCGPVMSTTLRGRFIALADLWARSGPKNGVLKKRPRTSIPWALTSWAASILSRPPENTQRAFITP